MRFGDVGRRPDPTLDVTPMIDVVFQLLLFFMVTTTFISSAGTRRRPRRAPAPRS